MKNQEIIKKTTIQDYTHEGFGVAKIDSFPIFVKGALKGEVVDIEITDKQKNFAFAKIAKFHKESPARITPRCEFYNQCGGCDVMHMNYKEQTSFKADAVRNIMQKNGITTKVNDCVACSQPFNYRNKIIVKVLNDENDKIAVGYNKHKEHSLLKIDKCLIIENELNEALSKIVDSLNAIGEKAYDNDTRTGNVRSIYLRKTSKTNKIMITLVTFNGFLVDNSAFVDLILNSCDNVATIVINKNDQKNSGFLGRKNTIIHGDGYIVDNIGTKQFRVSPHSFLQVNPFQILELYNLALQGMNLQKTDNLLDAFCGSGTIGILSSDYVGKVLGVEIVKAAIEDANYNQKINNVENAKFVCQDMEDFNIKKANFNAMIVNPPRKGVENKFMSLILDILPEKVAYISCMPATLARDLKIMQEHYEIIKITPVDMFPQTHHVETVVLLSRK